MFANTKIKFPFQIYIAWYLRLQLFNKKTFSQCARNLRRIQCWFLRSAIEKGKCKLLPRVRYLRGYFSILIESILCAFLFLLFKYKVAKKSESNAAHDDDDDDDYNDDK